MEGPGILARLDIYIYVYVNTRVSCSAYTWYDTPIHMCIKYMHIHTCIAICIHIYVHIHLYVLRKQGGDNNQSLQGPI